MDDRTLQIKDATRTLHDNLESLPFNVKMFKGDQTIQERATYLKNNLKIFNILDDHVPADFRRSTSIRNDYLWLVDQQHKHAPPLPLSPPVLDAYTTYLREVCDSFTLRPHIYLNYMGFMYGGQIMAKRYPNASSMYKFTDIEEKRQYIRTAICEDYNSPHYRSFVDEVKLGFKFHIAISRSLGEMFHVE